MQYLLDPTTPAPGLLATNATIFTYASRLPLIGIANPFNATNGTIGANLNTTAIASLLPNITVGDFGTSLQI